MKIKIDIPKYSLRSAYKAILKMALSILPESEISDFNFAFSCLKNNDIFGCEYIILNYYPGFNIMPLVSCYISVRMIQFQFCISLQ